MQSISGDFAMHRVKTEDGVDAILIVPEPTDGAPLLYGNNEDSDADPISFESVEGGESDRESYLTITTAAGNKIHFGPYAPRVVKQ